MGIRWGLKKKKGRKGYRIKPQTPTGELKACNSRRVLLFFCTTEVNERNVFFETFFFPFFYSCKSREKKKRLCVLKRPGRGVTFNISQDSYNLFRQTKTFLEQKWELQDVFLIDKNGGEKSKVEKAKRKSKKKGILKTWLY